MELTWLADTPQSRRRTRALRACATCQRRKKRCRHLDIPTHPSQSHIQTGASGRVPRQQQQQPQGTALKDNPSISSSQTERFVGDLNPEAVIREKLDSASGNHLRDRIGLWISTPAIQSHREQLSDPDPELIKHCPKDVLEVQSVASMLNQQYTSGMNACDHLPLSTRDRLFSIFFNKVNHVLPLVDQVSFLQAHSDGTASVFLERAVCLVAAKDRAASSHLRLVDDGPLISSRSFCSKLYQGLVVALNVGLEPDRLSRIRILALMSMHCEGHEGAEAASMHLCQAIHQAQTVGLHLDRPGRTPGDSLACLFWCLWSLDRMHACIGGRPVLLADCDIGIEKPIVRDTSPRSAFDIWFAISDLLSTVISFYRPAADHTVGWEGEFPVFEAITGDKLRDDLDFATLGLLEMYYHAVAILSCRYKLSHRSDESRPSYTRQGLAAIRIHSIAATECSQVLPPLPIVPYALTLSMGVSYQQFRSSKLITHLDRARTSLEACCTLLEGLGVYWYSAEAMARLGRKALHQIDEVELGHHQHGRAASLSTSGLTSTSAPQHSSGCLPTLPSSSFVAAPGALSDVRSDAPSTAQVQELLPRPLCSQEIGPPDQGNFTNIDMLFGDFLDLSLPTNFWDPVFFTEPTPET
ncbi:transcription factor domain-containing protein [Aspergillus ibericus CBS 121593]|uniref:Fungal-specific transcription factor n=1 Tax=Aspergillus ibericus CBS 121593 TaxID=1448316 RepID=A0A395HD66_9EURO|nr:fungal-specific transcription factor [Aspergillus ibericus CBS 121593]RAL05045.1 fungal-specific transcription factor [Aspergillus ibericus CBS 121593]